MNITERKMMEGILSHVDPGLGRAKGSFGSAMTADDAPPLESNPSVQPASQARFRAIVDAHFNFVWRYLRALGIPQAAADDAAQQVFIVAASKVEAIELGRERSFLVGTAHGVAANARRANERRREVQGDGELARRVDGAMDPEQQTESREAVAILDRFLASLPEELRSVFVLFELEGMTMAAISETLGIPPGTVASRLRRAREDFHEMAKRVQAGLSQGARPHTPASTRPDTGKRS